MADKFNLIFITIDSWRQDAMGALVGREDLTPAMDALARDGVLFSQAISNGPRTPSSFPAIMASLYPLVCGERGLPENTLSWAEVMQQDGYRTAAFNLDNPYLSRHCGYAGGFDVFQDFWDKKSISKKKERRNRRFWSKFKKTVQDRMGRYNLALLMFFQAALPLRRSPFAAGEKITAEALEWIDSATEKPFFGWLHYMDVHYPYIPLKARNSFKETLLYMGAFLCVLAGSFNFPLKMMRKLYEERVTLVDSMVGGLVEHLKQRGVYDRTMIVITSDHGDMFNEHGGFTHGPELYDELIRVPLIVKSIDGRQGMVINSQVELLGLAPTVLEMLAIDRPDSFQGRSFAPLLHGVQPDFPDGVFSEASHRGGRRSRLRTQDKYRIISCRTPPWKYILDEENGQEELYDLAADPGEQNNLAEREPERLKEMRKRMSEHIAYIEKTGKLYENDRIVRNIAADDEVREQLARLGYL